MSKQQEDRRPLTKAKLEKIAEILIIKSDDDKTQDSGSKSESEDDLRV